MMNATRFRITLVVWLVLYAWWWALPYSAYKQPPEVLAALEHSGRGAIVPPNDTIANVFMLANVIATAGLFFFQQWARRLFLVVTIANVLMSLLTGVVVSGAFDTTLAFAVTLLNGAIIALSFSGSGSKAATEPVVVYETSDPDALLWIHALLAEAAIEYTTRPADGRVEFLVRGADAVVAKDVIELGVRTSATPAVPVRESETPPM